MGELILRYGSQFGIGIAELGPNCRNEIAIGFVEIVLTLKRGKGLRPPPPPIPPAVPTRYAPDPVQTNRKAEREKRKEKKIGGRMLSFARDEIGTAKPIHKLKVLYDLRGIDSSNELRCRSCFQKRIANGDLWLCTRQHERPRSQLARSRVDDCRLCTSVQGKSLRCEDRSRRTGQAD